MTEDEQKDNISINNYDFLNNNNFDIDNIPWIISKYVFENNQEHGYKLHKGDIFKLGKYILRVREIGLDDDKKHYFFENKNTQKYIKNNKSSITINNASQMPLSQGGDNYFSALNLNQIINVQRKDDNNDNNNNNDDNNENIDNNENRSNNSNNRINVEIINNGSENNNSFHNSKGNSNSNSLNNNLNHANNDDKKKYNSVLDLSKLNKESKNENDNNSQKVISIYYSNNPSSKKLNNNNHSNEIISHDSNKDKNKNNNGGSNHYYINIINCSNIEENNNNNVLDESKNRINNSMNMNSIGFPTFHNSIINSSCNNSGRNVSNMVSVKNIENENENENCKSNINLNLNINNKNKNNCEIIKNSLIALKSTASFKKKKLTDIIKKNILKHTDSIPDNSSKPICRICLSEEYEENNPLIHPCNCDGTMKYIHLQCLRLLIQSKIKKTETESCKVFTFKTLECEICKMVFPEKVRIKNSIFSIIDFEKPDKDYIILDGLIKETPEEKSIFIVHFKNKKEIKIGRATDANIRLSDISVSRAHAVISQYNESFYLHDTNSKFGTLISAGNKFCILYNKPFSVQKGNILFEFLMKKTLCATLRCYRPSVVFYKSYNDFLDETFMYKYQTKEEEILVAEKTKTVSEYSSEAMIKTHQIKSSKNLDFYENYAIKNRKKKNNESIEENSQSNNNNSNDNNDNNDNNSNDNNDNNDNNSNDNNDNNDNNSNDKCDNINNNQQIFFETFKIGKDKGDVNNVDNLQSICVNKTQEISNIYQKNDIMRSNSKCGISIDNNANENSLLVNNVNNVFNDK